MTRHDLLLRAAVADGPEAVDCWRTWRATTTVDELDHDAQWLLPLLYVNLVEQGISENELARYANVYRHHWYRNLLLLRRAEVAFESRPSVMVGGAAIALERPERIGARPIQTVDTLEATLQQLVDGAIDAVLSDVSERVRTVVWRGRSWSVLDPADQLVLVCLQREAGDTRSSLLWLVDAATLIRLHPDLDGDRVSGLAERLGRSSDVEVALREVERRCGVSMPGAGCTPASVSPLVSVTIPVFNAERHLGDALRSVMSQTHRNLDVVVVDDGSTDRSVEIAAAFADGRIRVIRQPNSGAPAARNTGVAAAQGELLAFLDADDLWAPHKIERQVRALAEHPATAMVFGHYTSFAEGDDDTEPEHAPLPGYSLGTILVRRRDFESVGPLSTTWRVGDFIDWYGRAEDLGLRHTMLADTVLHRRVHSASLTAGDREAWVDYAKIARSIVRRRSGTSTTAS